MDLAKKLGTDQNKELSGVWVPVDQDGARLKIARAGNVHYRRALRELSTGKERALDLELLSESEANQILCGALARGVLLNWENIESKGQLVPYSVDSAKQMLIEYPEFRVLVQTLSRDVDLFRLELDSDTEKNSETSPASA